MQNLLKEESLDVGSDAEAVELAAGRVNELLPTLPLGISSERADVDRKRPLLSPKLMELLSYLVKGASNIEIAQRTNLPISTVLGRRSRLMEILGAKSAFDAAEKVDYYRGREKRFSWINYHKMK
jgi:DNA-binding NarL/FixJ family response regulator